MGNKLGFTAVFLDINRSGALPEETKMPANKMALKKIYKREDKRSVIYTDSQSSMQSIECKKENYPVPIQ